MNRHFTQPMNIRIPGPAAYPELLRFDRPRV